jgi:hypothetical protein
VFVDFPIYICCMKSIIKKLFTGVTEKTSEKLRRIQIMMFITFFAIDCYYDGEIWLCGIWCVMLILEIILALFPLRKKL